MIWGIPIALIAVWSNQVFVLVMLAIVGLGNTIVDVSGMTLLQRSAPDEVLARVFGVLESLLLLSVGLGAVVAPLLINWLGTRGALIVGGSLLPLVMIHAWPRLNAIDRMTEVPVERLELLSAGPIFAPRALKALIENSNNAALFFKHFEQRAHAFGVHEIGLGDHVRRAFDKHIRLIAVLQRLAAQQHGVAQQLIVESFFFAHPA